jgi:hypothetical protein
MGGVLTAAALGQSPLGWRRAVGEHPAAEHSEGPAWAYTAWLLADFLDFAADENGAAAKLTDRAHDFAVQGSQRPRDRRCARRFRADC